MLCDGVAFLSLPRVGVGMECPGATKPEPHLCLTSAFICATSLPPPLPTSSSLCASEEMGWVPKEAVRAERERGGTWGGSYSPTTASHRSSSQGQGEEAAGSMMASPSLLLSHFSHLSCPAPFSPLLSMVSRRKVPSQPLPSRCVLLGF